LWCVQDIGYLEADVLRWAIRNVPTLNALPVKGLNVFDVLKHRTLILTADALEDTIERLSRPVLRGFKGPGFDWRAAVAAAAERRAEEVTRRAEVAVWLAERGATPASEPVAQLRSGLARQLAGDASPHPAAST
jgi:Ribosomal protein L4/L1 family